MSNREGYVADRTMPFCRECMLPVTVNHRYRIVKYDSKGVTKYGVSHTNCENPTAGTYNVTGTQFERKDGFKYKYIIPRVEKGKAE